MTGFAHSCKSFFFEKWFLIGCISAQHAAAQLSPCSTVSRTTPNVIVFVSDIDRSVRWYLDQVGLAAGSGPALNRRYDRRGTVMSQNGAGLTLVVPPDVPRSKSKWCPVLDGPPAPPRGASPLFLDDLDETSVEFLVSPNPTQERE